MARASAGSAATTTRRRLSAPERRAQLIEVARGVFAVSGPDGASLEDLAAAAGVTKPVIYEHFGGKDGLYRAVVDIEMERLLTRLIGSLTARRSRDLLEQAALALLGYIEEYPDGFRILVRDAPVGAAAGGYSSLIGQVATEVQHVFEVRFAERGFDTAVAPMYSHMMVGMVALTGQWWLDARQPRKEVVAAHLVNLAWNGLIALEEAPDLASGHSASSAVGAHRPELPGGASSTD